MNKKNSGLYLCKANSPAGEDSMKIFVRVKDGDEPPTQAKSPKFTGIDTSALEQVNAIRNVVRRKSEMTGSPKIKDFKSGPCP